ARDGDPRVPRGEQDPAPLPVPALAWHPREEVRFSGMTLYDRQSRMMIDYLAGPRKIKTFGVLHQDDDYGKAFLTSFEKGHKESSGARSRTSRSRACADWSGGERERARPAHRTGGGRRGGRGPRRTASSTPA